MCDRAHSVVSYVMASRPFRIGTTHWLPISHCRARHGSRSAAVKTWLQVQADIPKPTYRKFHWVFS